MSSHLLLTLFYVFKFIAAAASPTLEETPEEVYQKLFVPAYVRSLERGDTAAARKELASELDVDYKPLFYDGIKEKVAEILDSEQLVGELYQAPRYLNLEDAKECYATRKEVAEKQEARRKKLISDIAYYEGQKVSRLRSVYDSLHYYAPGMAPYVDPLSGAPEVEALKKELAKLEEEMKQKEKFIDEHPRWFLRKMYHMKDSFGLHKAKEFLAQVKPEGLKQGEGQTVLIIDDFAPAMPDRIRKKCKNYQEFSKFQTRPDFKYHGVKVASIVVDETVGVAPGAMFRAADMGWNHYMPEPIGPVRFHKIKRTETENPYEYMSRRDSPQTEEEFFKRYWHFVGTNVELHHLHYLDNIIRTNKGRLDVLFDDKTGWILDVAGMELPEESVINMSILVMDLIGKNRNADNMEFMIKLVLFTLMILKCANAGKVMVWAAGNDMMSFEHAKAYSLVRALAQFKPECFISVPALDIDGTQMSIFSNQPGKHPIQHCSLSAPGTMVKVIGEKNDEEIFECGTSVAAPFVSGTMALLMSNFPQATARDVRDALLYTASPVVIKRSESRYGEFPVVIRGTRNALLTPGKHYEYFGKDGKVKKIYVTQEMIEKGREKYGVGIINVYGAATYLYSNFEQLQATEEDDGLPLDGSLYDPVEDSIDYVDYS